MFIHSYAKLNLSLAITGRLPNGYHTLDMIMQTISLHDCLTIKKARGISVVCKQLPTVDENNTAYQAAQLFFDATRITGGAVITIDKQIPPQAGLGGGSSNGAAVLSALNTLYDKPLSLTQLRKLALSIGADTPFFLEGGCMRAQGIGEKLTPIENQLPFEYLLIKPEAGVSTQQAYQQYATHKQTTVDIDAVAQALNTNNGADYMTQAGNVLYPAARSIAPSIQTVIKQCYASGADFAMMTGSGSCVFALYTKQATREAACNHFKQMHPFVFIATNTSAGHRILALD